MSDVREEGRRQAYLAALAIPLWTARHDLPGALPSAELEFFPFVDEVAASDVAPVVYESVAPEPLAAREPEQRADQVLRSESPEPVSARPEQKAVEQAPPRVAEPARPASGDHPRFACRVQLLAPGLMGVIALPDDVPDLSAQEYRLLENLVQAIGGDPAAPGAREHFRWPLSPNPSIPRDAGAAREALAAFLGRRREATRWLVLGETLSVYVRTALPQHSVIGAPLLRELLDDPAAKRRVWQALHG